MTKLRLENLHLTDVPPVHQNRASPFASDFTADERIAGNSAASTIFTHFLRRRNRGSPAIFFAEEIAHLGASKNRAIFRVFLNLWFGCGSPFTKTMEITKTTKTTQTATNKELSAGFEEITETTKMTKTTGIQGANHGLPKTTGLEKPEFFGER